MAWFLIECILDLMHGTIRTRRQRLISTVSFIFAGLFVAVGTIVLVLIAKGYNFDFSSKEIVQNGLILIGSEPLPAEIFLDGQSLKDTTPHRLTIPVGQHTVMLKRAGFRDWQRSFDLGAGEVLWLNYPLLLPDSLSTREVIKLVPDVAMEPSPDSSRLAIGLDQVITVYRTDRPAAEPIVVDIAAQLPGLPGFVSKIAWSDDNSRLLATITDGTTTSHVYLPVSQSAIVSDLTSLLNDAREVNFVPRQSELFYGLRDGGLWRISLQPDTEPVLIAESVDRYKSFETMVLAWSKAAQRTVLHQADRSTVLDVPPMGELLDMAVSRHDGRLVVALSSADSGTTVIIAPGEAEQAIHQHPRAGKQLLFSPGAGYLLSHSDAAVQVYDLERQRYYTYDLPVRRLAFARWATGAHIVAIADDETSVLFDFDGSNYQSVATAINAPVLLSPNQEHIFALARSSVDKQPMLTDTDISGNP